MPLDHSRANVRISVAGLALSCINRRMHNRCEVGILRCDRHRPVLDIQKIKLDRETRQPISSFLIPHTLNLDEDILINVIYPDSDDTSHCKRGVSVFTRRGFHRLDDSGDAEDFRWVPDLEGAEFHNRKLRIENDSQLRPRIFISDGILYARQKTDELFTRTSPGHKPSGLRLGRVGNGISADIRCVEGAVLELSNRSADGSAENSAVCPLKLRQCDGEQYVITIENHCQSPYEFPDGSEGTDFRLFYQVLKDPDEKQFDLRRIVETGFCETPKDVIKGREEFALDGYPESCLSGFLGRTESLTDAS